LMYLFNLQIESWPFLLYYFDVILVCFTQSVLYILLKVLGAMIQ